MVNALAAELGSRTHRAKAPSKPGFILSSMGYPMPSVLRVAKNTNLQSETLRHGAVWGELQFACNAGMQAMKIWSTYQTFSFLLSSRFCLCNASVQLRTLASLQPSSQKNDGLDLFTAYRLLQRVMMQTTKLKSLGVISAITTLCISVGLAEVIERWLHTNILDRKSPAETGGKARSKGSSLKSLKGSSYIFPAFCLNACHGCCSPLMNLSMNCIILGSLTAKRLIAAISWHLYSFRETLSGLLTPEIHLHGILASEAPG